MFKKTIAYVILLIMALSLFTLSACNKNEFEFELISTGTAYRVTGYTGIKRDIIIPGFHKGKPVTEIGGSGGFYYSQDIESVEIPADVQCINEAAFTSCRSLRAVTFASGSQLKIIDDVAFSYCDKLKSIEIPASVISIGEIAFDNCHDLESVTFESGSQLKIIGRQAFGVCSSLKSIVIPASVTSFSGDSTLFNNVNLESVFFAGSQIESLGSQPFHSCPNLANIYFGGTEEQWNIINTEDANINASIVVHFNWAGG